MDEASSEYVTNEWQVFTSTKYPATPYYFNVRTGEAAWKLSEIKSEGVSQSTESKLKNLNSDKNFETSSSDISNTSPSFSSKSHHSLRVNDHKSAFSYVPEDSSASDTSDVHSTTSVDSLPHTLKTRKWQSKKHDTPQPKRVNIDNNNRMKKIKITRPSFGSTNLASVSKNNMALEKEKGTRIPTTTCKREPLPSFYLQAKKSTLKSSPSKEASIKRVQFTLVDGRGSLKSNQESSSLPVLSQNLSSTTSLKEEALSVQNDEMPMEIDEPIDEEKMLIDIQEVRETLKGDPKTVCGELTILSKNYPSTIDSESKSNILCLVIDTNIFISDLKFLKDLPEELRDLKCDFIFLVPWVVLQELDALKNPYLCSNVTPSVVKQARSAVNYLHEELSAGNSHIKGQSIMEACVADTHAENNDDRVLQCCVHYSRKKNFAVILFSNDKNLCNKAIVSNVTACTKSNIMQSISFTVNKFNHPKKPPDKYEPVADKISKNSYNLQLLMNDKSCLPKTTVRPVHFKKTEEKNTVNKRQNIESINEISRKSGLLSESVSETCESDRILQLDKEIADLKSNSEDILQRAFSRVLEVEMEKVYEDMWLQIVIRKPPWNLLDLFECIKKHWIAVFGFFLRKSDSSVMDTLISLLKERNQDPNGTLKWIDKVLANGVALLMSVQNHSDYDGCISKSLKQLSEFHKKITHLEKLANNSQLSRKKLQNCGQTIIEPPSLEKYASFNSEIKKTTKNFKKRSHEESNDVSYEPPKKVYSKRQTPKHSSPLHKNRTLSDSSSSGTNNSQAAPSILNKTTSPDSSNLTNSLPKEFAANVSRAFGCIWDSLNHFCGVVCDSLGVKHTLSYEKPDLLPPREETLTFLPRIFPNVHRIFKALRKVLAVENSSSTYTDACYLLYTALVNFYPSLDSKDEENVENLLTPEMLISFCKDNSYRANLNYGLWQLEGYRSLLQQCISAMNIQHHI